MDHKATAQLRFDQIESELRALSLWLYENPEIAYEEHRSSARLAGYLEANGFSVEYPAFGLETAFDARVGSGKREVVICAEYDALPEVGHACGHNIIATAGIGAGLALAPIAEDLGITVRVLGTPAEETGGGKVDLLDAGAFHTADLAMMVHPSGEDVLDARVLAITDYKVEFHGKAAHAAATPEKGLNALDAAVQAYTNVAMLRQAMHETDRVHGTITYGGGAPNVIPAYTSMQWMVRAKTPERLSELDVQVRACFEAAARATGCTLELSHVGHSYAAMVTDRLLASLYGANSEVLGRPMSYADPDALDGSTDMGNVSQQIPAIHPMLDIKAAPAANHQQEYAAQTITAEGQRAIRDGALAMAWTIIDLAEADRWSELGTSV